MEIAVYDQVISAALCDTHIAVVKQVFKMRMREFLLT